MAYVVPYIPNIKYLNEEYLYDNLLPGSIISRTSSGNCKMGIEGLNTQSEHLYGSLRYSQSIAIEDHRQRMQQAYERAVQKSETKEYKDELRDELKEWLE